MSSQILCGPLSRCRFQVGITWSHQLNICPPSWPGSLCAMLLPVRSTIILSGSKLTNLLEEHIFPTQPSGPPSLDTTLLLCLPSFKSHRFKSGTHHSTVELLYPSSKQLHTCRSTHLQAIHCTSCFQSIVPGIAASTSPRNLRVMQICRLHPRITGSETLEVVSSNEF